ncbi:MAG: glycosyltransferase [Planctomycetes bacterium]|nr:glycosyltransferase [Planctomycetota bacterium]
MRIALVAHGFPPLERTGVENHVAELAAEFARRGHDVHVCVPRRHPRLAELALRTETRAGFTIHWLTRNEPPRTAADHQEPPGVERAFAEWLERERPDVVHVHHVAKLGLGVLSAARHACVPVVFTAHDHFAYCHRIVHLRPDLSRCTSVGDPRACARCDLAASALNRVRSLGDWQAGADVERLPRDVRERVVGALEDDFRSRRARALLDERHALDARRLAALAAVELVLAPSRFLAERLVHAGLPSERVIHEPQGCDVAALAATEPARSNGALRLGFVGGLSKHKGLHVLLEALAGLGPRVRLEISGETSDAAWHAHLRELARGVEATFHGGFAASERARVFARCDVVCVPSIWEENAPLVVAEGFAAGRPVLASRLGGLGELVRDGVDGVLVEPGDVGAWRSVIAVWIRDRAPLDALRANVRAPRTLAAEADALLAHYQRVLPAPRALPGSLVGFAREHAAADGAAFDALAERVARGLEAFRERVGAPRESGFAALVRSAVARDVLDVARDSRREREWLATSLRARQDASAELTKLARAKREADERYRAEHAALLAERDAVIAAKRAADHELAELVRHAETLKLELERAAREHTRLVDELATKREAERRLQQLVQAAVEDRKRVGEHIAWLERSLAELAADLTDCGGGAGGGAGGVGASRGAEPRDGTALGSALPERLAQARRAFAEMRAELEFRRAEMRAALDDKTGFFGKGALGLRLERWRTRAEERR